MGPGRLRKLRRSGRNASWLRTGVSAATRSLSEDSSTSRDSRKPAPDSGRPEGAVTRTTPSTRSTLLASSTWRSRVLRVSSRSCQTEARRFSTAARSLRIATTPRPVRPADGTATSTISRAKVRRKLSSSMGDRPGHSSRDINLPGVASALVTGEQTAVARASRARLPTPPCGAFHPWEPGRPVAPAAGGTDDERHAWWALGAAAVLAGAVACSGAIGPDGGLLADGGTLPDGGIPGRRLHRFRPAPRLRRMGARTAGARRSTRASPTRGPRIRRCGRSIRPMATRSSAATRR